MSLGGLWVRRIVETEYSARVKSDSREMAGTSDEKKIVGISFLGKKMYVPIVEIAFP
jgi:hypothetical protein